jgi:hypothetical protein
MPLVVAAPQNPTPRCQGFESGAFGGPNRTTLEPRRMARPRCHATRPRSRAPLTGTSVMRFPAARRAFWDRSPFVHTRPDPSIWRARGRQQRWSGSCRSAPLSRRSVAVNWRPSGGSYPPPSPDPEPRPNSNPANAPSPSNSTPTPSQTSTESGPAQAKHHRPTPGRAALQAGLTVGAGACWLASGSQAARC